MVKLGVSIVEWSIYIQLYVDSFVVITKQTFKNTRCINERQQGYVTTPKYAHNGSAFFLATGFLAAFLLPMLAV